MSFAIPEGYDVLIPHLVCSPCTEAIEYYKKAFGGESDGAMMSPDGQRVMHAEVKIGNKVFFLADDFPEYCGGASQTPIALGGTPVTIHMYVEDCDAAFNKAVAAGATPKMPPMDMFWGDRYSQVTDPFGHCWSLATHIRDMTPEEMQQEMVEAFAQADVEHAS
jgi:PhnB protein